MMSAVCEAAVSKLLKVASDKKKLGSDVKNADELRQLCEGTLATLSQAKAAVEASSGDGAAVADAFVKATAAVFVPFILALESKATVLVEESLDGLNELIAHGLLHDCADPRDTSKKLVEVLVAAVCDCGCMQDEKVQMYVVRVLQTAILSEPNFIHGAALLQSVRTCFNVHLGSGSQPNQSAAKAALSRIINAMIHRMEGLPPGSTKSASLAISENGRYICICVCMLAPLFLFGHVSASLPVTDMSHEMFYRQTHFVLICPCVRNFGCASCIKAYLYLCCKHMFKYFHRSM